MLTWMSQKEVSNVTGFSESALRHWRQGRKIWDSTMQGPAFFSVHGRIFYTTASVKLWMRKAASSSGIVGLEALDLLPIH